MKMVLAIINYDDSQDVISSLMKAGFSITKLATTGVSSKQATSRS
ncbi:MAG: cyclic-di-AMP receptor [Butyricicoccus sp.]